MKYKVKYLLQGEIELEADTVEQAKGFFNDRVGFSGDEIYENAVDEIIYDVVEVSNES